MLDELLGEASGGALEAYGKVAMGNLHLYTTPGDRRRDEQRHKAEAHLSHALELFRRVLEKEPGEGTACGVVWCVGACVCVSCLFLRYLLLVCCCLLFFRAGLQSARVVCAGSPVASQHICMQASMACCGAVGRLPALRPRAFAI